MVTSTINPNSTLPQQVIQQMINPIITQFQPQKIILFGSYSSPDNLLANSDLIGFRNL